MKRPFSQVLYLRSLLLQDFEKGKERRNMSSEKNSSGAGSRNREHYPVFIKKEALQ